MNPDELIRSLRREAERKVRTVWSVAETEAARIEGELSTATEGRQSACRRITAAEAEQKRREIIATAEREVMKVRHASERALSERLLPLARASLGDLVDFNGGDIFSALVHEAPPLPWKQVRVNARDMRRARELFPDAEITAEKGISGGVEVTTGDGSIRVVNTLEKRLENAWEELLPEITTRCYGEIQGHATAAEDR